MINTWRARFFIRLRQLRGRALTREAGYFHFLDRALAARRRYRISPYPGKITLFRYQEQPSTALYDPDPLLGWRGAAQSGLEIVDVKGAHSELSAEDFQELCKQLRDRLRAAQDAATAFAAFQARNITL